MAKLLIDFIETVDKISHKVIIVMNGYYLPKITSDQLSNERDLQGIPGEFTPDSRLNVAIKKSR